MNNVVKLSWVPGHSSVVGNEKADELARRGSDTLVRVPEPTLGIYAWMVKGKVKEKAE